MAKPNYSFAKRQREIAKKEKREAKRTQKAELKQQSTNEDVPEPPVDEASQKSSSD